MSTLRPLTLQLSLYGLILLAADDPRVDRARILHHLLLAILQREVTSLGGMNRHLLRTRFRDRVDDPKPSCARKLLPNATCSTTSRQTLSALPVLVPSFEGRIARIVVAKALVRLQPRNSRRSSVIILYLRVSVMEVLEIRTPGL